MWDNTTTEHPPQRGVFVRLSYAHKNEIQGGKLWRRVMGGADYAGGYKCNAGAGRDEGQYLSGSGAGDD